MFRDFEKAPSKSSYQLKFILAALAFVALMGAWISRSNTGHDLKSTQIERDQVTALLDERNLELQDAQSNILSLQNEKAALEEAIAAGEAELAGLQTRITELDTASDETQTLLSSVTDTKTSLEQQVAGLSVGLEKAQQDMIALDAERSTAIGELEAQIADLNANRDARVVELEAQLGQFDLQADERVAELKTQLNAFDLQRDARIESLQNEIEMLTGRLLTQEETLQSRVASLNAANNELLSMQQATQSAGEELANAQKPRQYWKIHR